MSTLTLYIQLQVGDKLTNRVCVYTSLTKGTTFANAIMCNEREKEYSDIGKLLYKKYARGPDLRGTAVLRCYPV